MGIRDKQLTGTKRIDWYNDPSQLKYFTAY